MSERKSESVTPTTAAKPRKVAPKKAAKAASPSRD